MGRDASLRRGVDGKDFENFGGDEFIHHADGRSRPERRRRRPSAPEYGPFKWGGECRVEVHLKGHRQRQGHREHVRLHVVLRGVVREDTPDEGMTVRSSTSWCPRPRRPNPNPTVVAAHMQSGDDFADVILRVREWLPRGVTEAATSACPCRSPTTSSEVEVDGGGHAVGEGDDVVAGAQAVVGHVALDGVDVVGQHGRGDLVEQLAASSGTRAMRTLQQAPAVVPRQELGLVEAGEVVMTLPPMNDRTPPVEVPNRSGSRSPAQARSTPRSR